LSFDNENNNLFNKISSKNDDTIFQNLKDELVQAIPIDSERLIINEKVDNTNNQVLISGTVKPPAMNNGIERNTNSVLIDLNELIKQKKYNQISNYEITNFLDENYGAQILRK